MHDNDKNKRAKRVTIRDVARAAGVSVGAASTALRNVKSSVVLSQATRERILKAAKDLRYRPHVAARVMAGRRLQTIGVLTTEWCMMGAYYSTVLRGIANTAEQENYHLIFKTVPTTLDMLSASFITEQQIDGVIIPAEAEYRTREALRHFEIPHVWLNTELNLPTNCVRPDEKQGMRLAVDHLVKLGHRRIAYSHHDTADVHWTTTAREMGYVEGLRSHGLEPVPTHEQYIPIQEHVDLYLDMKPRPTALMVYSDPMAVLACNRIVERGLRIPDDISVVGNEGVLWQRYAFRRLTTVKAPAAELGQAAVRMLIQEIETNERPESVILPQTIEINESTAPPPADP